MSKQGDNCISNKRLNTRLLKLRQNMNLTIDHDLLAHDKINSSNKA